MILKELTEGVGRAFVFDRIRPGIREYFLKAGLTEVPYRLFGLLFWLTLLPAAYIFMFYGWNFIRDLDLFSR